MTTDKQLENYLRAGYSGIVIVSHEEQRVDAMIAKVTNDRGFKMHTWSYTQGIMGVSDPENQTSIPESTDPIEALDEFVKLQEKSVLVFHDLHLWLSDPNPLLFRKISDALAIGKGSNRVIIITGAVLKLPVELEKLMTVIEFKLPDRESLNIVLEGICGSAGITLNGNREPVLDAAAGLTTIEAEAAFALSVVESKDITAEIVAREKSNTVRKNGILEIIDTKAGIGDIGGLEVLKEWLTKRRHAFSKKAKEFGLPIPKGVLMTGPPGVGKSLTAKAASNILEVPLLKLDGGKVFGSLVGESERNIRTAIQTAEAIAPCVLWVDEIEKAFSGSQSSGSTDGGTSARVFGTFLQWLQEKTSPVFVFATANNVTSLPPEFLRKGRFDEMFFADLPNKQERADIWRLHISKKGRKADKFNIERLTDKTEGFTGAEIEAALNEALFSAFDSDSELSDTNLMDALNATVPLSRTMAPQIDALRAWATGRARLASVSQTATPKQTGRRLA